MTRGFTDLSRNGQLWQELGNNDKQRSALSTVEMRGLDLVDRALAAHPITRDR